MKNFIILSGLVASLLSAKAVWASSRSIVMQGLNNCPAQLDEFKKAVKIDPGILDRLAVDSRNRASIYVTSPSKEPLYAAKGRSDLDARSSAFPAGMASWSLNPSVDESGKCVPIKASDLVKSLNDWSIPLLVSNGGNCFGQEAEINKARAMKPDLIAGIFDVTKPTTTPIMINPSNTKRVLPGAYFAPWTVVNPGLKNGKCDPIKAKEIVKAIEDRRNSFNRAAKQDGKFGSLKPLYAPETLDSKVRGVKVYVGNMQ